MTETDMSRDERFHAELVQRRASGMLYRRRAQALEDSLHEVIDETSSEAEGVRPS